jgi:hypothetical protein
MMETVSFTQRQLLILGCLLLLDTLCSVVVAT